MAKRFRSTRRKLMKGAAATIAAAVAPVTIGSRSRAQSGLQTVNMQLGWITGGNQLGEVVAKRLGYFEQEKINFAIQAGGPNIDGVAIVASGRYEIGQVSSSPSLMLAASQGIPVTCFAVGAQEHPYAFFSLPRAPIRTPKDMIGRKIGVQATGQILLSALLRKNGVPEDQVEKVIIGSDMTPLMTGQVDAVTGWITNTTALKVLGTDAIVLRLWDCGVRLYALPYYATTDTLTQKPELLAGFLGRRAAAGPTPKPIPTRRSISWCRNTPISCAPTNSTPRRSCSMWNSLLARRPTAGAASILRSGRRRSISMTNSSNSRQANPSSTR